MSYYSLNWFSSAFGPAAVLADKEVLFWKASTGKISGSPDLLFDSTAKTLTLGSGGVLLLPDGLQATPSLSFSSDTDTGICWASSGNIAVTANNRIITRFQNISGASVTLSDTFRCLNDNTFSTERGIGLRLSNAAGLGVFWSSTTSYAGSASVALTMPSAGQLSLSTGSQFLLPDGTAAAPSLAFANFTGTGLHTSGGTIRFSIGGGYRAQIDSACKLLLNSTTAELQLFTAHLATDGAEILAQRNGANAQTFRIYNTFTDATNFERGGLKWESSSLKLFTDNASPGIARSLVLNPASLTTFSSGHITPSSDALYSLGTSATRWFAGFFGGIAASVPLTVKAHASQSANLLECQNSSGTQMAYVSPGGDFFTVTGIGGTGWAYFTGNNAGGFFRFGRDRSTGGGLATGTAAYAGVVSIQGNNPLQLGVNTAVQWGIQGTTFEWYPIANASYDIGTSALRVRTYYGLAANLNSVTKTGTYTATSTDHVILCNAAGGAFSINLPAASTVTGLILHVKKTDSSFNHVTIDASGTELIDDTQTFDLVLQGENLMMQCDGTKWNVI